jgi:hypothetical protein
MEQGQQLTGEQDEWLRRVAFSTTPLAFVPVAIGEALVAAGYADKNLDGTFDVNAAGRRYLERQGLTKATYHREP